MMTIEQTFTNVELQYLDSSRKFQKQHHQVFNLRPPGLLSTTLPLRHIYLKKWNTSFTTLFKKQARMIWLVHFDCCLA